MKRIINDFLFVYGTLKRANNSEMSQLLAENAEYLGYADYRGRLYKIDYYPGAVPSDDPKHNVRGEVYRLNDANRLLSCLDRYEECGPGFPAPNEYRRRLQEVLIADGTIIKAWIYLYNRSTVGLELIESYDFIEK